MDMVSPRLKSALDNHYLLGRNPPRSRWWIGGSIILFALSAVFWSSPAMIQAAYDLSPIDIIGGGFVLIFVSAAVHAYSNDGMVISWLLVFFSVLGATLNRVDVGLISPSPLVTYGIALGIAGGAALLLGTVGIFLGVGSRRLGTRVLG